MFGKFLDPKNDVAFKRIFGTEKHKNILIHFLNDVLGFSQEEKITQISFLRTAQDPDIASKKQSIVDVLCTDEKGCQYIVEMQVARTTGFEKRAQYYAAKAYVSQFSWSKEELNTYEQEKKRELDAKAILLQREMEGVAKGLVRGRAEGLVEGIAKGKAEGLVEGIEKGKAEGLIEGIEKGKKDALLEMAKQMLDQGLDIEKIVKFTHLSQTEIYSVQSLKYGLDKSDLDMMLKDITLKNQHHQLLEDNQSENAFDDTL